MRLKYCFKVLDGAEHVPSLHGAWRADTTAAGVAG